MKIDPMLAENEIYLLKTVVQYNLMHKKNWLSKQILLMIYIIDLWVFITLLLVQSLNLKTKYRNTFKVFSSNKLFKLNKN